MKSQRPGVRRMMVEATRTMLASPAVFLLGAALIALVNHLVVPGVGRAWRAAFGVTDMHSLPSVCVMVIVALALLSPLFYGLHVAALRQMRTGRASVSDLLQGARHFDRAVLGGLSWAFAIGVYAIAIGLLVAVLVLVVSGTGRSVDIEDMTPFLPLVRLMAASVPLVLIIPVAGMAMPVLADRAPLRRLVYFCPPNSPRHFWPLAGAGVVAAVATHLLGHVPPVSSLVVPWFACMMTRTYLDIESERRRQTSR